MSSQNSKSASEHCSKTANYLMKCIENSVFNPSLATTMLPPCRWLVTAHQLCLSTMEDKVEDVEESAIYKQIQNAIEKDLSRFPSECKKTPTRKICCDCRETKRARDACIVEGDEKTSQYLIKAHNFCLADEGFQV